MGSTRSCKNLYYLRENGLFVEDYEVFMNFNNEKRKNSNPPRINKVLFFNNYFKWGKMYD